MMPRARRRVRALFLLVLGMPPAALFWLYLPCLAVCELLRASGGPGAAALEPYFAEQVEMEADAPVGRVEAARQFHGPDPWPAELISTFRVRPVWDWSHPLTHFAAIDTDDTYMLVVRLRREAGRWRIDRVRSEGLQWTTEGDSSRSTGFREGLFRLPRW